MASLTPAPVATAVIFSFAIGLFIVFATLAIVGSYFLTLHAIHVQELASAAQAAAAKAAQLKSAIPTCKALVALDNAQNGIHFSPPSRNGTAELYVLRLVKALHQVVASTNCQAILRSVRK